MDEVKLVCYLCLMLVVCFDELTRYSVVATNDAENLWRFLFENSTYNKYLRPVKDWNTQTEINLQLSIIAIVDFNEVEETITMTAVLKFSWNDEYLTWKPATFGNLTHIYVPQFLIWKPYLTLENSILKLGELGTPSLDVLLDYDGNVTWKPVEVFTVSCAADVYKFPFDTQTCHLAFEPSGYSHTEIILTSAEHTIDLHEYEGTSGWTITDSRIEATIRHSEIYLVCSLTLERKPLYFLLNIFLPILLLSILNMCVFILPAESGEKISFVVTIFLSLAVFLTIVSGKLPENSDRISLLNIYVFTSTFVSTLVAVLTIIQIRIQYRDSRIPVAYWLQRLTRMFTMSHDRRVSVLQLEDRDKNCMKTVSENDITQKPSTPLRNVDSRTPREVTWPDVVKAFDNLFFVVFIFGYSIITISLLAIAMRK